MTKLVKLRRIQLGLKMIGFNPLILERRKYCCYHMRCKHMDKLGREKGLAAGANILMPIITIPEHRAKYLLYDTNLV